VAGLFWEKSTVGWWLISQANMRQARTFFFRLRPSEDIYNYTYTKVIIPRPSYSIVQRAIEASFTPVTWS
jgi:hypothetical protein